MQLILGYCHLSEAHSQGKPWKTTECVGWEKENANDQGIQDICSCTISLIVFVIQLKSTSLCNILKVTRLGGEIMGSMAFWYDKDPNKADIKLKAVMNFNLWTQCSTNGESFLDIGFNVFGISEAKNFIIIFRSIRIKQTSKIFLWKSIIQRLSEQFLMKSTLSLIFQPLTVFGRCRMVLIKVPLL